MTFIMKYQIKNREDLLTKATRIANSKDKNKKFFTWAMRIILLPLYLLFKIVQCIFKIPMYVCIGIGSVMEYIDELVGDLYHLVEDWIFITLYKVMKIKESEGTK